MSQRMHVCFKCENKVRTLYEWKGEELFCGMCQQGNIERYEATLVYRFFLLIKLTRDYLEQVRGLVLYPEQGWTRKATKFTVYRIRGVILYVERFRERCALRSSRRRARRAERRSCRAEKRTLRKRQKAYLKTKRKEQRARNRAAIRKAAG